MAFSIQKHQSYLKKGVLIGLFFTALVAVWFSGVLDYLTFEAVKENREIFLGYVQDHSFLSLVFFAFAYIVAVVLSLPIASLLTLLGGFLFGVLGGGLLVVISATIGATLLFLIARTAFGEPLREKAGPFYQKVAQNMEDNAVQYMLFMRLAPILPFFIANILPSLFKVKVRDFFLTTFFGIIPGTFVYANIGRNLGHIDGVSDLISGQMIFGFFALAVLSILPTVLKFLKGKK